MCKVSIIIPYYNSEKTILRALNSAGSQTYKDYEIILINDGSIDNSENIVQEFMQDNKQVKIKNIYQSNRGPSVARNVGIRVAKGEYVAFLDSDDEWEICKLHYQIDQFDLFDNDMIGCSCCYVVDNKKKMKYFGKKELEQVSFRKMLLKHYFTPSCVIVKRDILIEMGGFPKNQRYMEDALLFTMISRKYKTFISNKVLVKSYKYPYGDSGLSSKLNEMEWNELQNFKKLKKDNYLYREQIGELFYLFVVFFSIFKYLRRKIIVFLFSLKKQIFQG